MSAACFVDTNLLVYSRDASEPAKQPVAHRWLEMLWRSRRGRLSFQVLQEYYVTVTRKLRPGMPVADARADVRSLLRWSPLPVGPEVLESAFALQDRYSVSFWDAMVIAAAQLTRCGFLLTEDLQDEQDFGGVKVINPFVHDIAVVG